jgi:hypothetical protein
MSETTVTQNPPQQPNAMGGAPTTTSDVNGTIQPNPQAAPNTPSANPQTNPTAAAPATQPQNGNVPSGQGNNQPQQGTQPHPISRIFDSILKTASGGPIYVNDPVTGERREVQQSKGSMARAITAAALAGLFAKPEYRQTPFGPARDEQATMSNAFEAGKDVTQKRQQQAQQVVDDQQSRKLFTVQNNAKLVQQAAAMAHQQHEVLADTIDRNQKTFMAPLDEYDKNRLAGEPSIYAQRGMTSDQVINGGHKLTDNNVIIDGSTTVRNDETGVLEDHPTYSIVRTTDAQGNPISLKLPESVTTELGKFNKPYEQAYKLTGGNVAIPVNSYFDAVHQANTLSSVEAFLTRAQKAINPTGTTRPNLAAAYKADPQGMQSAVDTAEKALAAGTGRPDSGTDDQVIKSVRDTNNGSKLLALLGVPSSKIDSYISNAENTRTKARNEAALKNPNNQPAGEDEIDGLRDAADKLPDGAEKTGILAAITGDMSKAQVMSVNRLIGSTARAATTQANKELSPQELSQTANSVVEGVPTKLSDVASLRDKQKNQVFNAVQAEAQRRGLNPDHFGPQALEAKADMYKDYAEKKKGSTGENIAGFDTFLGHVDEALDANDQWRRSNSPLINKPISWLAKNATNDPSFVAYEEKLLPAAKEFMSFLNGNRAEHTEDIKAMNNVLDPNLSPAQIEIVLKGLAQSADVRLASAGRKYLDTMYTTYPGLLSDQGKQALQRMGFKSQAVPLSQNLPKGWQGGAPQGINPPVAQMYLNAAGGNPSRARSLAAENGWKF